MAGQVTLNGEPVIELNMHLTKVGAWSAELQVASGTEIAVGDSMVLDLLGSAFVGRVVRAGGFADRLSLRLTGGALDWSEVLEAKHYKAVEADAVATDLGLDLDEALNVQLP